MKPSPTAKKSFTRSGTERRFKIYTKLFLTVFVSVSFIISAWPAIYHWLLSKQLFVYLTTSIFIGLAIFAFHALYKITRHERDFLLIGLIALVEPFGLLFLIRECFVDVQWLIWTSVGLAILLTNVGIIWLLAYIFERKSENQASRIKSLSPYFISDRPNGVVEDELGFKKDAFGFAHNVLNNGFSDSIVFGIDAPWGSGKTTYLQFCKERWNTEDCLVYEFQPLLYNRPDLISIFLKGFGDFLAENDFPHEAKLLFKRYSKKISTIPKFWNIDLPDLLPDTLSEEDLLDSLSKQLDLANRKIVVIIDDLDRLPASTIKQFLDMVRVGLVLKNVTFVVCYDSKNIHAFEQPLITTKGFSVEGSESSLKNIDRQYLDDSKLAEYFEKIVNVKQTLVIHPSRLKAYLLKHLFEELPGEGAPFDPRMKEDFQTTIDRIFQPENFYQYAPYIGDLRKIIRLINVVRLRLTALNVDFTQLDFDGYDLIHLFLIYINFPDLFRMIYAAEIEGKELFSLKYDIIFGPGPSQSKYVNSQFYVDSVKTLPENQQRLIRKIFNKDRFESNDHIPEAGAYSAALNGTIGTGRNLENYLRLMTESQPPDPKREKKFYVGHVESIVTNKTSMTALSLLPAFDFTKSKDAEINYKLLIEAIRRNAHKLSMQQAMAVVDWIESNLEKFSVVNLETLGIGLRDNLPLKIISLLDQRGWIDDDDGYYKNTDSNVIQIANKIFGTPANAGLLTRFLTSKRGVLGLFYAIRFRLHCVEARGGHFFNLYRALEGHAKNSGLTNGDDRRDQMREITQVIYKEFASRYIEKKQNFIQEIYDLSPESLYGSSLEFIKEKLTDDEFNKLTAKSRLLLVAHLIYQLVNANTNQLDFGCGIFDPSGTEDRQMIRDVVRGYLFNVCFAPTDSNPRGPEFFADYMLVEFRYMNESGGRKFVPNIPFVEGLLGESELRRYWEDHSTEVKKFCNEIDKEIDSGNYKATYGEHLPEVFRLLDKKHLTSTKEKPPVPAEDIDDKKAE